MNCYKHTSVSAIGICKNCYKALCRECSEETDFGLACKETCIKEVNDYGLMISRSKNVYGLGNNPAKFPTSVLIYGLFAAFFLIMSLFFSIKDGEVDIISVAMFFLFVSVTVLLYLRQKKFGIKM